MQSIELKVKNVKCGGCADAIRNGLHEIANDLQVEVEIDKGIVSIRGESLPETVIHNTLAQLGYPVISATINQ